jgi:hypothetical protein
MNILTWLNLVFRNLMYSPKSGKPLFPNVYNFQNDTFGFITNPGVKRLYRP